MKRIVLTLPFALVGSSMCLSAAAPTTRPALCGERELPPGVVAERDIVHYSLVQNHGGALRPRQLNREEAKDAKEKNEITQFLIHFSSCLRAVVANLFGAIHSRAMRRSSAWSWADVGTDEGVATKDAENIAAAAAARETDLP